MSRRKRAARFGMRSRRIVTAVVCVGLISVCGRVAANGWEHGAVPLDALVNALSFDSPVIRQQAAQSLGYRQQEAAVDPLLERLGATEPDPWVRRAIYRALGDIGAERSMSVLSRCLDEEPLTPLRAACAEALGGLGTSAALAALVSVLDGDPDPSVRAAAVAALGAFDSLAAVQALAELIDASADPDLRRRAVRALGRTGANAAADPLLAELRRAQTGAQRLAVVQALAGIASPRATVPLTALLADTTNPRLRAAIAVALGASRDGDARDALRAMLEDPVPAVRYMAIESLERLGAADAAPDLTAVAIREGAALERREVAEWTKTPLQTVAALSLQTRALRAATELDPEAARPALLEAAAPVRLPRDSARALEVAQAVYRRRRAALYGLGYLEPGPRILETLTGPAGLGDPDPRLRAVAVRSLGVLGPPDAAALVRPFLGDPASEVRMTAARVLGRLGAAAAVPALQNALSDDWALVRREAALALGYIGDPAAEAALSEAAAQDESRSVREAAAYAVTLLSAGDG